MGFHRTMGYLARILSAIFDPEPMSRVSVEVELDMRAAERADPLDWRHSIVDLMKLLGLNSSREARRDLAIELGYEGNLKDTATMNTWLHERVMERIEERGWYDN